MANLYINIFNKTFVNSVGLFLDIVGACLIFRFGLPEEIDRHGYIYVIVREKDEKEKEKAKKYDFWAKVGIGCLIIGFFLQIISNCLNE